MSKIFLLVALLSSAPAQADGHYQASEAFRKFWARLHAQDRLHLLMTVDGIKPMSQIAGSRYFTEQVIQSGAINNPNIGIAVFNHGENSSTFIYN